MRSAVKVGVAGSLCEQGELELMISNKAAATLLSDCILLPSCAAVLVFPALMVCCSVLMLCDSCLYAPLAGLRLQSAVLIRQGIHQCSKVGYNPRILVDGLPLLDLPLLSTLLEKMQCGLPVWHVPRDFKQPAQKLP